MLGPPQCRPHRMLQPAAQNAQARTAPGCLSRKVCLCLQAQGACVCPCAHAHCSPALRPAALYRNSSLQELLFSTGARAAVGAFRPSPTALLAWGPLVLLTPGCWALRLCGWEQETENSIGGFLTTSCYKGCWSQYMCEHRHTLVMHAGTTALNTVI